MARKKSAARIRFEDTLAGIFAVPKDRIAEAEAKRLKRPSPKRKS